MRPLLTNQLAPLSVSVGAASLLLHLHSRLEVPSSCYPQLFSKINIFDRRLHCPAQVLIKENSSGDASPAASSHDDGNLADSEEFEADTPILWEVRGWSYLLM